MSATNRGADRRPHDFYATPSWCVHRLVEEVDLPGGQWLEPCAGDGDIIATIDRADVHWHAAERRPACGRGLHDLVGDRVAICDFINGRVPAWLFDRRYDVILTNPPFSLAIEFVIACLPRARVVAMLLRLNFLATESRAEFMRDHVPDVYVLPNRPSFTRVGTDSVEYAWFVWREEHPQRRQGMITVLASTPAEDRS